MPPRTQSIFSNSPMTPVEATATCSAGYADRIRKCAAHLVSIGFALLAGARIGVAAVDNNGAQHAACADALARHSWAPPGTRSSCIRRPPPRVHRRRSRQDRGVSFSSGRSAGLPALKPLGVVTEPFGTTVYDTDSIPLSHVQSLLLLLRIDRYFKDKPVRIRA